MAVLHSTKEMNILKTPDNVEMSQRRKRKVEESGTSNKRTDIPVCL